ncbi:unannotated protein [freshwater metagenome]|uniref:Unannotated protein n=1 Tax=freshwater metagenome TaxID=449393 RepID=A0A6J6P4T5_9ZZZZ
MYALRLLSAKRSIVATTSAEVKSLPSCHLTPLRRLKVQTLPSSFGFHDSANIGDKSAPKVFTRYSNDMTTGV